MKVISVYALAAAKSESAADESTETYHCAQFRDDVRVHHRLHLVDREYRKFVCSKSR